MPGHRSVTAVANYQDLKTLLKRGREQQQNDAKRIIYGPVNDPAPPGPIKAFLGPLSWIITWPSFWVIEWCKIYVLKRCRGVLMNGQDLLSTSF
ncbi:hypothetical protein JTE90_002038 [Oedothorax gibbosus]|uniref:Uncharacterized protein n=1 Tax=Oedothorax gibbosus TaxID=931172 RepID=A0AAV6UQB1_9ARAC|nr:hypothetical protein JTE90_002038 [Oedothorax gibbosus]